MNGLTPQIANGLSTSAAALRTSLARTPEGTWTSEMFRSATAVSRVFGDPYLRASRDANELAQWVKTARKIGPVLGSPIPRSLRSEVKPTLTAVEGARIGIDLETSGNHRQAFERLADLAERILASGE